MKYLKIYNLIRTLSIICFVILCLKYWGTSYIGMAFMLTPYVIVFLLAHKNAYKTKLRAFCRVFAGVFVSLLAIALLFGIESDPQASIGIGFAVLIQYGILFIFEAIIGFATYQETSV